MPIVLFVSASVLLFCSYAYSYLWSIQIIPVTPAVMFVVTIVAGLLLALFRYGFVLPPPKFRHLIYWVATFLLLSSLSVAFAGFGEQANQHLTHYFQGALMLVVFAMLFRSSWIVNAGIKALVAVVLFGSTLNILEFFGILKDITLISGRSAGFYENPNLSAFYLTLGFCTSALFVPKRFRTAYAVAVFLGVFVTFSRSGILICGLMIGYLGFVGAFALSRIQSTIITASVALALVLAFTSGSLVDFLGKSAVEEYMSEDATNRISIDKQQDSSVAGRASAALAGVELFMENPLLGIGVGGAIGLDEGMNTHNVYVQSAVEMGFLGLFLIFWLMFIVFKCGTHESNMFLLAFFVWGFFNHNILDQPAFFIMLALAAAVSTRHSTDYPPFVRRFLQVYWREPGASKGK
ncbi:MAG: O-antigen ligase family protein [Pseudomonadota bacterium]